MRKYQDFNSIKVQLKRFRSNGGNAFPNFNSIKVQLNRFLFSTEHSSAVFPFHKGTIKTEARVNGRLIGRISIP